MDNRDLRFVDRYLPELSPLLLELDEGVLDRLSLRRLPPDTLLYQQEDWDESPLYVLIYGVCKLFCNYESLLFPIYCPQGSVIGTLEALSEDFVLRTANMSSFTEAVLLSIPRRLLQREVYDLSLIHICSASSPSGARSTGWTGTCWATTATASCRPMWQS